MFCHDFIVHVLSRLLHRNERKCFVKNIATVGIQTVGFYTKFMREILEFWLKEYGQAKSGSTSKQTFYELTKAFMNEFKGICIHPDLVHFVAEFSKNNV